MGPRIIVTWALPVDTVTLGGRLEAYVESKASLHTFKLCIQHSQADRALGKLPAEMIENIASIFQQAQFEDRIEEWIEARECEDGDLDEREDVSDRIYTSFDKCQKVGLAHFMINDTRPETCPRYSLMTSAWKSTLILSPIGMRIAGKIMRNRCLLISFCRPQ